MPGPVQLQKAVLQEISWDTSWNATEGSTKVTVQFNPETLSVTYGSAVKSTSEASSVQFTADQSDSLSLDLWFDVTASSGEAARDVRKFTQQVAYFITPKPDEADAKRHTLPGVRFLWGSFLFDGVMKSLTETLEFFSKDGIPLRAKMSIKVDSVRKPSGQSSSSSSNTQVATASGNGGQSTPLAKLVAGKDWKKIAQQNGIENPRMVEPGTIIKT